MHRSLKRNPDKWVSVAGMRKNVATSLRRAVKNSDIGERTSVSIQKTDLKDVDGETLYEVYARYLPE